MTVSAPDIRLSSEFPTNADRTAGTFNPKAHEWANTSRQMAADMEAAGKATQTNADAAEASARTADASVRAASAAAAEAAASASAAALASGAIKWVAGTYEEGICVWSPLDLQTYRCSVTGPSAIDPSKDKKRWAVLGVSRSKLHAAALYF